MLELRNLTKRYKTTLAVDNVSLRLEKDEFFCLLGPSGCGKSTILKMIAGFERPDSGQILLHGKDISLLPPYRRDLNMVFQSYALFPHMNVLANISYGLKIHKVSRKEIERRTSRTIELTALKGLEERMPAQLSGGQKQRVALARALVNQPAILLLDEPMSALDKKISEQMRRELKELQKQVGIIFIYVTHNQTEALSLSDRIAVMNAGRIEQMGTPREIYETPETRFTAGFIGSMNFFPGQVSQAEANSSEIRLFGTYPIVLAAPERIPVGDRVLFCIRPERLKISLLPPAAYENSLPGVLIRSIYQGDLTIYDIRLDSGEKVSVNAMNYLPAMDEGFFEAGERVHVIWSKTSGRLIHE